MTSALSRRSVLCAAVLAVYLNSLWASFQFDDYNVIVLNPAVHSLSNWLSDLPGGIRPVLKLSYAMNWALGHGPASFHAFNLIVHAVNVCLVYALAARFLQRLDGFDAQAADRAAFAAALLFAVHPVHTEAITYIAGRSASLSTAFYLGSLLAYDKGASEGRPLMLYALSPLLFAAAVAVKETAVTLPLALALWEACGGRRRGLRKAARLQASHWAVFALISVALAASQGYNAMISYSVEIRPLKANLLSQMNGVAHLLSKYVLVNGLNMDPAMPVLTDWSAALAALAAAFAAALLAGLLALRKIAWLSFGLLWFFLHILPANSVLPRIDIANERHLYASGFGLFLAAAVLWTRAQAAALRSRPWCGPLLKAAAIAAVALLAAFTIARNHDYRSEVALWEDTAAKSPLSARAHNNLGYAYALEGRVDEAKAAYEASLLADPGFSKARRNLDALLSRKDHQEGP